MTGKNNPRWKIPTKLPIPETILADAKTNLRLGEVSCWDFVGNEENLKVTEKNSESIFRWINHGEFNVDSAIANLRNFFRQNWNRESQWRVHIELQTRKFKPGDVTAFVFETCWSIPTRKQPVPSATGSIFFIMDVCNVKKPEAPVIVSCHFENSPMIFDPLKIKFGGKMLVVQAIMRLFEVHSRRFETILQPRNAALAYFRSESTSPEVDEPETPAIRNSPGNFEFISACSPELCEQILQDFIVVDDFLSEAEERSLMEEVESQLARVRYENEENWDNAIIGYRETEKKNWNSENKKILKRVRELAFPPGVSQLVNVHILDLAKDGFIKPHVDSVRFCGDTIAGLSLLSPAVLRLVQEAQKDPVIDVLLKRRSLYIMKGIARYNYTHEILRQSQSVFKGEVVERDRRISLIFRNEPGDDDE